MIWQQWWVWLTAAAVLGILEVFLPGFVLVGFGIGAAAVGLMLWVGFQASLPLLVLIFAVISLVAWLVLRRVIGVRDGQIKIWDRDINED